jgi:hypothetical protein
MSSTGDDRPTTTGAAPYSQRQRPPPRQAQGPLPATHTPPCRYGTPTTPGHDHDGGCTQRFGRQPAPGHDHDGGCTQRFGRQPAPGHDHDGGDEGGKGRRWGHGIRVKDARQAQGPHPATHTPPCRYGTPTTQATIYDRICLPRFWRQPPRATIYDRVCPPHLWRQRPRG